MVNDSADDQHSAPRRRPRRPLAITLAALALFLVSLALPAFHLAGDRAYAGIGALLFGPLGLLSVVEWDAHPHKIGYLAWLANPAFLLALVLVLLRRRRPALIAGSLALLVAPLTLLLESLPVDEGGGRAAIEALGAGCWLWLGALVLAWIAALGVPPPAPGSRPG